MSNITKKELVKLSVIETVLMMCDKFDKIIQEAKIDDGQKALMFIKMMVVRNQAENDLKEVKQ